MDDTDSDEEDLPSDNIRDYANSLTAPELSMTPNSSPISPAIVRKSISKPNRYSWVTMVTDHDIRLLRMVLILELTKLVTGACPVPKCL